MEISPLTLVQDVWQKHACFYQMIIHILDQSTDIAVICGFLIIMIQSNNDNNNNNSNTNCNGLQLDNMEYLFVFSLVFLLSYRIVTGVAVSIAIKNAFPAIGQLLMEIILYRAIWVNYHLNRNQPCRPQKWLQQMESMLQSFPQSIVQMYFLLETDFVSSDTFKALIVLSIIFSILSLVNMSLLQDEILLGKFKSRFNTLNYNFMYLLHALFRILDISGRVSILALVWSTLGGYIAGLSIGLEFLLLLAVMGSGHQELRLFSLYCIW